MILLARPILASEPSEYAARAREVTEHIQAKFFDPKSGYSAAQYSWVAVMGSGGELIATPDAVTKTVHNETLAQATTADPHSSYVGWWLPDGTS